MKEQVIFPEPQNVTILATREGKLTQIPGSEFRAPIAPHEFQIDVDWSDSSEEPRLKFKHPLTVSIRVIGLFQQMPTYPIEIVALPDESRSYSDILLDGYKPSGLKTFVYWKKAFSSKYTHPQPDTDLQTLVEITSYNTFENSDNDGTMVLPECYGTTAFINRENPGYSQDKWPW